MVTTRRTNKNFSVAKLLNGGVDVVKPVVKPVVKAVKAVKAVVNAVVNEPVVNAAVRTPKNLSEEQILKQIHKNAPKGSRKLFNHFNITKPNLMHQIDLLELPTDEDKHYVVTVVDCASRYKGARAVSHKTAEEVTEALIDLYTNDEYLDPPRILNSDDGSEFKGDFAKWCRQNKIKQIINAKSYHCGFVENFNGQLAKRLFKYQDLIELKTKNQSKVWVKYLQPEVKKLNNTVTSMIKMKPIDAIKLKYVPQPKNNFSKAEMSKIWPIGTEVRRLLNTDEVLTIVDNKITTGKRRITDPNYTIDSYFVELVVYGKDSLPLHQIKNSRTGVLFPHWLTYYKLQKV